MKKALLNLVWSLMNLFIRTMLFLSMILFVTEKDHDQAMRYGVAALIFGLWVAVDEIKTAIRERK